MLKGLDNGNTFTKDNQGRIFKSAFTYEDETLSDNRKIIIDGKTIYFGAGMPNVEVDRTSSKINEICTLANIAMTGPGDYKLVVGTPIIQYKEKKDKLRETVLGYNGHEIIYKGREIKYRITDVAVCAQGLGAVYQCNHDTSDKIFFDIGSFTINVVEIEYINGLPKIKRYDTWYRGTLTLFERILKEINQREDLTITDTDEAAKILKDGLTVDGNEVDITYLNDIIKAYLEPVFTSFKLKFPTYKIKPIVLMGGGSIFFEEIMVSYFKNSFLMPYSQFANAQGYYDYGLLTLGE